MTVDTVIRVLSLYRPPSAAGAQQGYTGVAIIVLQGLWHCESASTEFPGCKKEENPHTKTLNQRSTWKHQATRIGF